MRNEEKEGEKRKTLGGQEAIIWCRLEGWLLGRALVLSLYPPTVVIYFWLDGAARVNNTIPLLARLWSGSGLVASPLRCQPDT
jgi:hypothetical protein